MEPDGDGIKRYVVELLTAFTALPPAEQARWQFDLYIYGDIVPLADYKHELHIAVAQRKYGLLWYEKYLLAAKDIVQRLLPTFLYDTLAPVYRQMPFRWVLQRLKKGGKLIKRLVLPIHKDKRFAVYDCIHLPLPQHEDPFHGLSIPFVATVHDVTDRRFPDMHQARNRRLARKGMAFLQEAKAHIIAVSAATKVDIATYYDIPDNRLHVVYEAADGAHFNASHSVSDRLAIRERYGIGEEPYLLTLSTIEPRKNLLRTVQAFQQMKAKWPALAIKLVIAGKYGWKSQAVYQGINFSRDDIIFTGFVEESDLPILYSEALALCYVSLYEGFGLPPLEAMLCGTPVIYGATSSMPEVVGPAGIGVLPTDTTAICEAMHTLVSQPDKRAELAAVAVKRGELFSWRTCAQQTLAVYAAAIEADRKQ